MKALQAIVTISICTFYSNKLLLIAPYLCTFGSMCELVSDSDLLTASPLVGVPSVLLSSFAAFTRAALCCACCWCCCLCNWRLLLVRMICSKGWSLGGSGCVFPRTALTLLWTIPQDNKNWFRNLVFTSIQYHRRIHLFRQQFPIIRIVSIMEVAAKELLA